MKVLVTGGSGQLAFDVKKQLLANKIEFVAIDSNDADITSEVEVSALIEKIKPTVIIHCAAYTAVDKAEEEKDLAYRVNVLGTRYIAQCAKKMNAKLVYISTDYVFSGDGDDYYSITDEANPISCYGKTKYLGELEVTKMLSKYFIVRVSWVFGTHGSNFVKTMLRLGQERDSLNVVNDQIGSPTYTGDLAKLLIEMIRSEKYGTYHATNSGICSWYEFTQEIFKIGNIDCKINGIPTSEYPTAAKRPLNSRLSKKSLVDAGFNELQTWQSALSEMINQLQR